jgi:hypothetical protein
MMDYFKRKLKVPVIVDLDDNLFSVPISNETHDTFMNPRTHSILRGSFEMADVVTVSQENFREIIGDKAFVLPNALDDYLFEPFSGEWRPEKTITWRGARGHERDLYLHREAIIRVVRRHPDYKIVFLGWDPYFIKCNLGSDQYHSVGGQDIVSYMESLKDFRPQIHIVPLADDEFNRYKSNLALVEAHGYAGANVVCPDSWEGANPAITYGRGRSFEEAFERAFDCPRVCWKPPLLSKVNQLRLNLLEELVNASLR